MQRGFVAEILEAYGGIRASMQRQSDFRPREATITAYIMLGCFTIFLSFLPRLLATDLSQNPDQSLAAGIIVWFFIVMFFLPLVIYALAALSHLIARQFAGTATAYDARLATAWALVICVPIILFKTLIGSALIYMAADIGVWLNLATLAVILWIWSVCLSTVEGYRSSWPVAAAIFAILGCITFGIYLLG